MKIYEYRTILREDGSQMVEETGATYLCDGRSSYDKPKKIAAFVQDRLRISNSADEIVYMICLNGRNHIIGVAEISHGSGNKTAIGAREVFQKALLIGASSIIITHNHPSGYAHPSKQDDEVTHRLADAGKLIGIPLIDHIIITPMGDYFSYSESRRQ